MIFLQKNCLVSFSVRFFVFNTNELTSHTLLYRSNCEMIMLCVFLKWMLPDNIGKLLTLKLKASLLSYKSVWILFFVFVIFLISSFISKNVQLVCSLFSLFNTNSFGYISFIYVFISLSLLNINKSSMYLKEFLNLRAIYILSCHFF